MGIFELLQVELSQCAGGEGSECGSLELFEETGLDVGFSEPIHFQLTRDFNFSVWGCIDGREAILCCGQPCYEPPQCKALGNCDYYDDRCGLRWKPTNMKCIEHLIFP